MNCFHNWNTGRNLLAKADKNFYLIHRLKPCGNSKKLFYSLHALAELPPALAELPPALAGGHRRCLHWL